MFSRRKQGMHVHSACGGMKLLEYVTCMFHSCKTNSSWANQFCFHYYDHKSMLCYLYRYQIIEMCYLYISITFMGFMGTIVIHLKTFTPFHCFDHICCSLHKFFSGITTCVLDGCFSFLIPYSIRSKISATVLVQIWTNLFSAYRLGKEIRVRENTTGGLKKRQLHMYQQRPLAIYDPRP